MLHGLDYGSTCDQNSGIFIWTQLVNYRYSPVRWGFAAVGRPLLVGGWPTLKNMSSIEFVSWGYYSQYMEKQNVPNHQPVITNHH